MVNIGDDSISQFSVSATGVWAPLTPATVPAVGCSGPMAINKASGGGEYLYAISCYDDSVLSYSINASTGLLTQGPTASTGLSPQYMAISGDYMYVTNTNGSSISMYNIQANGSLNPLAPPEVASSTMPESLVVDSLRKVAYLTDYATDEITWYNVAADGKLSLESESPVKTGNAPAQVLIK